jgi:hypothetical protein
MPTVLAGHCPSCFTTKSWVEAFKRVKKNVKDDQGVGRSLFASITENVDVVRHMILEDR